MNKKRVLYVLIALGVLALLALTVGRGWQEGVRGPSPLPTETETVEVEPTASPGGPAAPAETPTGPTEEISPSPTEEVSTPTEEPTEETEEPTVEPQPTLVQPPPTPTPELTSTLPAKWEFFSDPESGSWVMRMWDIPIGTTIYAPSGGILWAPYDGNLVGAPHEEYVYICIQEDDGSGVCFFPGKVGTDIKLHSPVIYDHNKVGSVQVSKGDPLFTIIGGGPSYISIYWKSLGFNVPTFQVLAVWHDPQNNIIADEETIMLLFEGRSS